MTSAILQRSLFAPTMGEEAALQAADLSRFAHPVAVPGIFLADGAASSSADRCHSLGSLFPPQAAVASLPMVGMTVDLAVAVEESLKK